MISTTQWFFRFERLELTESGGDVLTGDGYFTTSGFYFVCYSRKSPGPLPSSAGSADGFRLGATSLADTESALRLARGLGLGTAEQLLSRRAAHRGLSLARRCELLPSSFFVSRSSLESAEIKGVFLLLRTVHGTIAGYLAGLKEDGTRKDLAELQAAVARKKRRQSALKEYVDGSLMPLVESDTEGVRLDLPSPLPAPDKCLKALEERPDAFSARAIAWMVRDVTYGAALWATFDRCPIPRKNALIGLAKASHPTLARWLKQRCTQRRRECAKNGRHAGLLALVAVALAIISVVILRHGTKPVQTSFWVPCAFGVLALAFLPLVIRERNWGCLGVVLLFMTPLFLAVGASAYIGAWGTALGFACAFASPPLLFRALGCLRERDSAKRYTESIRLLDQQGARSQYCPAQPQHRSNRSLDDALIAACRTGNTEAVGRLIDQGADVNARDAVGDSVLRNAVTAGKADPVRRLLEAGADVDDRATETSTSVLTLATEKALGGVVDVLLAYGADATSELDDEPPLLPAIHLGHMGIVDSLLAFGADPNAVSKLGVSPLFVAVQAGNAAMAKALLAKGADPNADSACGALIWLAATKGQAELIDMLADHGAAIDQADSNGVTPLWAACQNGLATVVEALLRHQANIEARRNTDDVACLWQASYYGHADVVRVLLSRGADTEVANKEGATPLWVAAQSAHMEVVGLLVRAGANINAKRQQGDSALWYAAQNGKVDTVLALLSLGADANTAMANGVSALWQASQNGHGEVVRALLDGGADPNKADERRASPLWIAAQNGHTAVIERLLQKGASPDAANSDGVSPFWQACNFGRTDVIRLLLQRGSNVNQMCCAMSPLHIACQKGLSEVALLLLSNGADVHAVDMNGAAPLWIAVANGLRPVVQEMLRMGAKADVRTAQGSALRVARERGYTDIIDLLLTAGTPEEANLSEARAPEEAHENYLRCPSCKSWSIRKPTTRGMSPLRPQRCNCGRLVVIGWVGDRPQIVG